MFITYSKYSQKHKYIVFIYLLLVFVYLKNTLVGISVIELNTSTLTTLEITFQMDNVVFLAYAIYRLLSNKDLDKTLK
jgi:F0F1-type ATP synthase membrane subunit a